MLSHTMCIRSRFYLTVTRSAWKDDIALFTHFIERYMTRLNIIHCHNITTLICLFVVQLRKSISTPPFPSKRIRCSQPKVLEQRRAGLERYLQTVFKIEGGYKQVMEFLGLKFQPRYAF